MGNLRLSPTQNQNQSGYTGYGSYITVERDTGTAFPGTIMGALMGITALNIRTNVIPSSHMRSLGRFQSFSPGLRDSGELAAAVNWLPGMNDTQGRGAAEWSLLRQATLESNELTKIRVFAPDPDLHLVTTKGFLTQLGPLSYQPEAIMSGQVGWKLVGQPDIVTPIVYRLKDYTNLTATTPSAATVTTSSTGGNGVATLVTTANSSDSGSVAAGIRIGSAYVRDASTVSAVLTPGAEGTANVQVTVSGFTSSDVSSSSQLRFRMYVPGEYEIWSGDNAANPNTQIQLGADDAERKAFIDRITDLEVPDIHLAIYGAAEL